MSARPEAEDSSLERSLQNIASSKETVVFVDLIDPRNTETWLKNLLEIFSAAIKNPHIQVIIPGNYVNKLNEDQALITAIGSPAFKEGLLKLLTIENFHRIGFIENIVLTLINISKDKVIQDNLTPILNKIEIIRLSHSDWASPEQFRDILEKLPIRLHRFFKDQKSLKALKEVLLKVNQERLPGALFLLEKSFFNLDLAKLVDVDLKAVEEFFNTCFPEGMRSIQIVNEKSSLLEDDSQEAKFIIETLNCIKKSNVQTLKFEFKLNERTPKFNLAVLKGFFEIPTLRDVDAGRLWSGPLGLKSLFDSIEILQKNTGITFLNLDQNNFGQLPYPILIPFVEKVATLPAEVVNVWDWSIYPDPTIVDPKYLEPSKKEGFIKTLFLLSCKSLNPKHMRSSIISKEKEFEYFCECIKTGSLNLKALRLLDNTFSPEQRFALVKTLFDYSPDIPLIGFNIDLRPDQRLRLFLDCGFSKLQEGLVKFSDKTRDSRYNVKDWQESARALVEPWVALGWLPPSELDDFEPDSLSEQVLKLIPVLARASQTVWPSASSAEKNFYDDCFDYIKKRFEKSDPTDRVAVFRGTQLCQWYTWFTINLSTLTPPMLSEQLFLLSPVMKELAAYPDRKMRYALSQHLFSMLKTEVGRKQYFECTKESRPLELPYKILLAKIFLTDPRNGKTDKEIQEIFNLLRANKQYKDGHNMRTFISALNGLCNDKSLTPIKKLLLIKTILQGSGEDKERKKEIEDFFKKLKIFETIQSDYLKEKLTEILGIYAESVLSAPELQGHFSKEKISENDFAAIKRTIKQKFEFFQKERALSEQLSNWRLIAGLSDLRTLEKISSAKTAEEYRTSIFETFEEIFQLTSEEMKHYQETFGSQRDEAALLTYLGRIRTLKVEEAKVLEESLIRLVKSLLTKDRSSFYKQRYDGLHLRTIFKDFPHLGRLWKINQKENFNVFLKNNKSIDESFRVDYVQFLQNKIYGHSHLPGKEYQQLKNYLEDIYDPETTAVIKAKLEKELKEISERASVGDKKTKLRIELQLALIKLLELQGKETKEAREVTESLKLQRSALSEVMKLLEALDEGGEFRNDIKALLENLDSSQRILIESATKDWSIGFTDDYWDLFMCGTDVAGSCQRVDGDPRLNRCLMAYLKDGKVKMIAIKDAEGKILARSIVRLLWDDKDKKPVLYLEELYPSVIYVKQRRAIEVFAKHLAEDLRITLLSATATETSSVYPNSISSLSGVGPEYVDALHAASETGIFTIPSAQIAVKPSLIPPVTTHFNWSNPVEKAHLALAERLVAAAAASPFASQDAPPSPSLVSLHFSAQPASPTPAVSSEAAPTSGSPAPTTSGSAAGEASSPSAEVPERRPDPS